MEASAQASISDLKCHSSAATPAKVSISSEVAPITAASVVYGYRGNIQVFKIFDAEIMKAAWQLASQQGSQNRPALVVVTDGRVLHLV